MTDQAAHEARLRDSVVRGEDIDLSHEELLALLDALAASRALVEQMREALQAAWDFIRAEAIARCREYELPPDEQHIAACLNNEENATLDAIAAALAAVPDRNEDT